MDPNATYHEMFCAMRDGDYVEAREMAINLKVWLGVGGFIPPTIHPTEFRAYIESVLRRTRGVALD